MMNPSTRLQLANSNPTVLHIYEVHIRIRDNVSEHISQKAWCVHVCLLRVVLVVLVVLELGGGGGLRGTLVFWLWWKTICMSAGLVSIHTEAFSFPWIFVYQIKHSPSGGHRTTACLRKPVQFFCSLWVSWPLIN